MFFFFFLWLLTSTLLILVAGLVESHLSLYYFFFLFFRALLEDLEFWMEVPTKALALNLSLQWSFITFWVWTLCTVVCTS